LIKTRCSRGADIARKLGFSEQAAAAVRALDEHWDGRGEPYGLKGEEIPLLGRIACLAQTVEVYFSSYGLVAALEVAHERSGKWFDPDLVSALMSFHDDHDFWATLNQRDVRDALGQCEPEEQRMFVEENRLDAIAEGFADVIDAKSPWTSRHSFGVAEGTVGILRQFGHSDEQLRYWRRAALLHDIGNRACDAGQDTATDKTTDRSPQQSTEHTTTGCITCRRAHTRTTDIASYICAQKHTISDQTTGAEHHQTPSNQPGRTALS
tara:strand:- start:710311 stop:711108 length:798 start_codon:yes stop_codon:yes gene_type:complete